MASAALTLLAVSMLVFAGMRMIPGGYAEVVLGPQATAETRAEVNRRLGLDRPLAEQYLDWLPE